jgi:hypothetical protein
MSDGAMSDRQYEIYASELRSIGWGTDQIVRCLD